MARPSWNLLRLLLARQVPGEAVDDSQLLQRFSESKDAAAFELLVRRHADLVYGVCRRVCRDEHDAEDAFQTTFLVLARKARSIRRNLAGWLHRTANRAALRAAARRVKRRETALTVEVPAATAKELAELRAVLDAEIDRLPERLRLAVLHCFVEGRTTEDAAKLLGVPRGTVQSRLGKAREVLSARLTRRGITTPLTATTLTAALTCEIANAMLVATATSSVLIPVAGTAAEILSLEVLRMTAWKSTTALAAALVLTAGIGTGVGISMAQGENPAPTAAATPRADPPATPPKPGETPPSREQERQSQRMLEEFTAKTEKLRSHLSDVREKQRDQMLQRIDPKVLADAIARIDSEQLSLEEAESNVKASLAEAEEALKAAKAWKPAESQIADQIQRIESPDRGGSLKSQVERLQRQVKLLEEKAPGFTEELKQYRERLQAKEKELRDAEAAARPAAEKFLMNEKVAIQTNVVKGFQKALKDLEAKRQKMKSRREELVARYRAAPGDSEEVRKLERELERNERTVDEIQRVILRHKLGLQGETSAALLERLTREIAELRDEVRRLKEKK